MNDQQIISHGIREKSLSKDELILDYFHCLMAIDELRDNGYAILGFEMDYIEEKELIELKHYITYFPDHIVWDEFIESSYEQIKENISKEYLELQFSEINEDFIYFNLTYATKEEFESYYYEFIKV